MLFDQVAKAIADSIILFNLLSFLLGLWAGFRFNLWRDRRNDFNKTCPAIRRWLLSEIEDPNATGDSPSRVDIEFFISLLPYWQRARFTKDWEAQEKERDNLPYKRVPDFGMLVYSNTPSRELGLKRLLKIASF